MLRLTLVTFLASTPMFPQILTGSLSGTVQDSSGLPVNGAAVSLTAERTNQRRSSATDATGAFVFTGLEAGTYTVTVTKDGFKNEL